jgi:hypothetical protein
VEARHLWTLAELDARLQVLEDASEKGDLTVSRRISSVIGRGFPGIDVGTPITTALEIVFEEQENLMAKRAAISARRRRESTVASLPGHIRHSNSPEIATNAKVGRLIGGVSQDSAPLGPDEARDLTTRIKNEIHQVCFLLAEAHDRRAWAALGYITWDRYVRREFGFSRSRSYEILDQASVILAIQSAAGSPEAPDLSPYTARRIKPHLSEVVEEIRDRVAAGGGDEPVRLIDQVVSQAVAKLAKPAQQPHSNGKPTASTNGNGQNGGRVTSVLADTNESTPDLQRLISILDYLAGLPAIWDAHIATEFEAGHIDSLRLAIGRLTSLASKLNVRIDVTTPSQGPMRVSTVARAGQAPTPAV